MTGRFGQTRCKSVVELSGLLRVCRHPSRIDASRRRKGKKPPGPCRRSEKEGSTGVCEGWHHRRGLAHVSAHRWDDAGRDGRTSTHDPRLLASQQSPWDEQVSSSNVAEQTPGTREIGRCYLAGWRSVGEQINSHSVVGVGACFLGFVRGKARRAEGFASLLDPNGPRFFSGSAVSA